MRPAVAGELHLRDGCRLVLARGPASGSALDLKSEESEGPLKLMGTPPLLSFFHLLIKKTEHFTFKFYQTGRCGENRFCESLYHLIPFFFFKLGKQKLKNQLGDDFKPHEFRGRIAVLRATTLVRGRQPHWPGGVWTKNRVISWDVPNMLQKAMKNHGFHVGTIDLSL